MKIKLKNNNLSIGIAVIMLLSLMFTGRFTMVQALEGDKEDKVSICKDWTITFSDELDYDKFNEDKIYIVDDKNQKVETEYSLHNESTINIKPIESYEAGSRYTLVIEPGIYDKKGNETKKKVEFKFETGSFSDEYLVMAWQGVYNQDAYNSILNNKDSIINNKPDENALQIINPTIFRGIIKDGNLGVFEEVSSEDYLNRAKENGYEVWPTVQLLNQNGLSYSEYAEVVNAFLNNNKEVEKLINQLYEYVKKYDLKGINIDFEGLGADNRDAFSDFMEELYHKFSKENIKVSVCISYPTEGSPYFDFVDINRLNKSSDYIMFMAYDERGINSEESGSISSYGWVKKGIEKLLESGVSNDKLILGVPLYTMDFAVVEGESDSNSVIVTKRVVNGETATLYKDVEKKSPIKDVTYGELFVTEDYAKGLYKVKYNNGVAYIEEKYVSFINPNEHKEYAVGWNSVNMNEVNKIIENPKYESKITYDEIAKQDVLTYYLYDSANTVKLKHKVWLENEKSIEWRKELVKEYNLKGIGAWSLGGEEKEVWTRYYK